MRRRRRGGRAAVGSGIVALALTPLLLALLAPVHHLVEAERLRGVSGHYPTYDEGEPAPGWHQAGPGVAAAWAQGGESGFGSIACGKADTTARATSRPLPLARAGRYRLWIRHAEARSGPAPLAVTLRQAGRVAATAVVGAAPTLDPQDEALATWGWRFVWSTIEVDLGAEPVTLELGCDRAAAARRHVDALLVTDDLAFRPEGRRVPPWPFLGLLDGLAAERPVPAAPRALPAGLARPRLAGRDLVVGWNLAPAAFARRPPVNVERAVSAAFEARYPPGSETPIFSSPLIAPVFYLDVLPEALRAGTPSRAALDAGLPFLTLANYARAAWAAEPAKRAAVEEALRTLGPRHLGVISGESLGYPEGLDEAALRAGLEGARTRAEALEVIRRLHEAALARTWAPRLGERPSPWRGLVCALSARSSALAHALARWTGWVGIELAAGMPDFPARLAFARGAARQAGVPLGYYHAPNFGDSALSFSETQSFSGPSHWFFGRYSPVQGPSLSWYRQSLLLAWLSGAQLLYLEQGFDPFFAPGPGAHAARLTPAGEITDELLRLFAAHPERGEPLPEAALLVDPAHGWDDTLYTPRAFGYDVESRVLEESDADRMLEGALDVLFHPRAEVAGRPATAELPSFPPGAGSATGVDVLTAEPGVGAKLGAYPVIVVGEVAADAALVAALERAARAGATVLVAADAAPRLERLLWSRGAGGGLEEGALLGGRALAAAPYARVEIEPARGTEVLARTPGGAALAVRRPLGRGAVVGVAISRGLTLDARPAPVWAAVIASARSAARAVSLEARDADGPTRVLHTVARSAGGLVVGLYNPNGVAKPQQGLGPLPEPRRAATVRLWARGLRGGREWLSGAVLPVGGDGAVTVTVGPGASRVVALEVGH